MVQCDCQPKEFNIKRTRASTHAHTATRQRDRQKKRDKFYFRFYYYGFNLFCKCAKKKKKIRREREWPNTRATQPQKRNMKRTISGRAASHQFSQISWLRTVCRGMSLVWSRIDFVQTQKPVVSHVADSRTTQCTGIACRIDSVSLCAPPPPHASCMAGRIAACSRANIFNIFMLCSADKSSVFLCFLLGEIVRSGFGQCFETCCSRLSHSRFFSPFPHFIVSVCVLFWTTLFLCVLARALHFSNRTQCVGAETFCLSVCRECYAAAVVRLVRCCVVGGAYCIHAIVHSFYNISHVC